MAGEISPIETVPPYNDCILINDRQKVSHGNHNHYNLTDLRSEGKTRLIAVLAITSIYLIIELAAGFYTGSLALLADAGHMLTDIASLLFAIVAFWFSSKPATVEKTYGYYRSEILASLINGIFLVGISGFILFEAFHRLSHPPQVMSVPMLVVGVIGLLVNLISIKLLQSMAEHSLNIKAAYLEVLGDLLATAGVILAGVIMLFTKWYMADPIISAVIGILILPRTWHLLSDCVNILMEGTPGHVDLGSLRRSMLNVAGVLDVHDIHVWTITSGLDAMSSHVTINKDSDTDSVLSEVTHIVQEVFGIHHTTIQLEQTECKGPSTCQT